jgi:hypothetical protein
MSRDPRRSVHFSQRDVDAFVFIGQGYEVTQYQLHEAVFRGRSEVVVSRFVRRWAERGFLIVQRWNNIGVNRLRLTASCRDDLVARGVAKESELFVPQRGVALKDIAHTMWINDLRIVVRETGHFELVLPAWALQRRFAPAPRAIPDILAIRRPSEDDPGLLVAAEVDLGGERLNSIFLPKLLRLEELVQEWAGDADAQIVIVTRGAQRASLLRQFADEALHTSTLITLLPEESGREGLNELRAIVGNHILGVNSRCSVELTPFVEEPANFQALSPSNGVRVLEEETREELPGSDFGFPTEPEEARQRLAELAAEARELRLRILADDDEKQFIWRRLAYIRDYTAEIARALKDQAE